jgi:hypothetical protein
MQPLVGGHHRIHIALWLPAVQWRHRPRNSEVRPFWSLRVSRQGLGGHQHPGKGLHSWSAPNVSKTVYDHKAGLEPSLDSKICRCYLLSLTPPTYLSTGQLSSRRRPLSFSVFLCINQLCGMFQASQHFLVFCLESNYSLHYHDYNQYFCDYYCRPSSMIRRLDFLTSIAPSITPSITPSIMAGR